MRGRTSQANLCPRTGRGPLRGNLWVLCGRGQIIAHLTRADIMLWPPLVTMARWSDCLLWETSLTVKAGLTCLVVRGAQGIPCGGFTVGPLLVMLLVAQGPFRLLNSSTRVPIAGLPVHGHMVSCAPHCLFLFNGIPPAFHCYEFLTAFCPSRAPLLVFESVYIDM